MRQLIIAGLGGFIGSAFRYGASNLFNRMLGPNFPYGTLFVNLVGSFFIGFLMASFDKQSLINSDLRIFLAVGILGGFTTFSAFSYETVSLFKAESYLTAAGNVILSVAGCLAVTWLGAITGKLLAG